MHQFFGFVAVNFFFVFASYNKQSRSGILRNFFCLYYFLGNFFQSDFFVYNFAFHSSNEAKLSLYKSLPISLYAGYLSFDSNSFFPNNSSKLKSLSRISKVINKEKCAITQSKKCALNIFPKFPHIKRNKHFQAIILKNFNRCFINFSFNYRNRVVKFIHQNPCITKFAKKTTKFGIFLENAKTVLYEHKKDDVWNNFSYSGSVRQGFVSESLVVPLHIKCPDYAKVGLPLQDKREAVLIKSFDDIEKMRESCCVAREVLDEISKFISVGVSTDFLDRKAHEIIISKNAYPSPLNYWGFPKSICTSVNEVICHGIPDSRLLLEGDVINVDITVYYKGFHGDCSETYIVGALAEKDNLTELKKSSQKSNKLKINAFTGTRNETFNKTLITEKVKDTELVKIAFCAMRQGIEACRHGIPINVIGREIENYLKKKGCKTFKELCGHGIGRSFHEEPMIMHTCNDNEEPLQEGMIFTVEPIVVFDDNEAEENLELHKEKEILLNRPQFITWPDMWTIATADGRKSAQFEHTILITKSGFEILTEKNQNSPKYFWEN